jgi:hypothetical protein
MRLTELLGMPVREASGRRLGVVVDVRFVLDGPPAAHGTGIVAEARLHGLLVGRHPGQAFAGYERTDTDRPALVNRFLAWRQRRTVLVLWRDVAALDGEVVLRPGATRYAPALRQPGARPRPYLP